MSRNRSDDEGVPEHGPRRERTSRSGDNAVDAAPSAERAAAGGSPGASDDAMEWDGFAGLDRLLDHRVRLAACVLLSRHEALSFRRLREVLGETDGNLGAHLRKLEEAQYVRVRKQFQNRKPVTWYSLTKSGRRALQRHVSGLQGILRHAVSGPVTSHVSSNRDDATTPAGDG